MRFIVSFISLAAVLACQSAKEPATQPKPIAAWRPQPLAFARFAELLPASETVVDNEPDCMASKSFAKQDLCAPKPLLVTNQNPYSGEQSWVLPRTPEIFFWQHDLRAQQKLRVEIIDEAGLPWPAKITLTDIGEHTVLAKLQPTHQFPKDKSLYLVANITDGSSKPIETWLSPLKVANGYQGQPAWLARPSRAEMPAKKPAKRKAGRVANR